MSRDKTRKPRPYPGFTCTCGHWDAVHDGWFGRCLHGHPGFIPINGADPTPCECEAMS